ncbi:MAG: host-nuclease inhibitor Gam family protein [Brevinema sp.]
MKEVSEITSMEDLKEASSNYAKLSRDLELSEIEMNKEIDKIKNRYDIKNAGNKAKQSSLKTIINGYMNENKDTLITEQKRSIDLPLAIIGYRKSSEVSVPNAKMASILEALKNQGRYEYIETKETVKKSALSGWSNEALAEIGVSRKEKDVFFIEVKSENL